MKLRSKRTVSVSLIPTNGIYLSNDNLNIERIFRRIQLGKRCRRLYLIALSEKEGELFVIYPAKELMLPFYDGRQIKVAGIGVGRKQTLGLLEQMISDIYRETHTIDVDHYFNP